MSYEDPFASAPVDTAPAEEAQQQTPTESPWDPPAQQTQTVEVRPAPADALSITFKGDGSYSAPWLVPKYTSVTEALVDLGVDPDEVAKLGQGQKWFALMDRVTKMADHFANLGGGSKPNSGGGGNGGGGQQRQSRAPQQAQEAPGGEERFCKHGKMEFKSGVSKAGNTYALFSCTAPRNEQCPAQYPSKKNG
ncbi:hypothetical protein PBI_STARSTUFF_52 [Mycobacterium phage StarStuff]|nr:hypothetical protein PBI_STARSTUFF_52 [Mycobacterium phage StarStuff]